MKVVLRNKLVFITIIIGFVLIITKIVNYSKNERLESEDIPNNFIYKIYSNNDTLMFQNISGITHIYCISKIITNESNTKRGMLAPAKEFIYDSYIYNINDSILFPFYSVHKFANNTRFRIEFKNFEFTTNSSEEFEFPYLSNLTSHNIINDSIGLLSYEIEAGQNDFDSIHNGIKKIIWNWHLGLVGYKDSKNEHFTLNEKSTHIKRYLKKK